MTVTTTTSRVTYVGNGVTLNYVIPYEFLQPADIVCTVDDVTQVLGTDYTIAGDNSEPGSVLSFVAAPADEATISIVRKTEVTQLTEYTPYGPYKAEQHEADFDKAALINQEHSNDIATKSDIGHDHPDLYYTKPESDSRFAPAGDYALQSVQITSGDTRTLNVSQPSLADDVQLTARTNQANGLAQLDASGNIPLSLLPPGSSSFLGGWDASGGGAPPNGSASGEYYVVSVAGTVIASRDGNAPSSQLTDVNDQLLWDANNNFWWLFSAALGTIVASSVLYDNTTSGLTAGEVQKAIDELASGSLNATYFEGRDLQAVLKYDGRDAVETVPGGVRVRDPVVSGNNPAIEFADASNNLVGLLRVEDPDSYPTLGGAPVILYAPDGLGGLLPVFVATADEVGNSRAYLLSEGEVASGTTDRGLNVYRGTGAPAAQTRVMLFDGTIGAANQAAQLVVDDASSRLILQAIEAGFGVQLRAADGMPIEHRIGNDIRAETRDVSVQNSHGVIADAAGTLRSVGFNEMTPKNRSSSYTLDESDIGSYVRYTGTSSATFTLPATGEGATDGSTFVLANASTQQVTLLPGGGGSLTWFAGGSLVSGARTLAPGSVCTAVSLGGGAFECWGQLS